MKKTILIAALFIGLLITSSGFNKSELATNIGHEAPSLGDSGIDDVISANRRNDRYTLLTFWSVLDANSRNNINKYTAWHHKHEDSKLSVMGVNLDDSENLFNEIVRLDGLDRADQFQIGGNDARRVRYDYSIEDGYGSVLIDPSGLIVAHNPTPEDLYRIVVEPNARESHRRPSS